MKKNTLIPLSNVGTIINGSHRAGLQFIRLRM